MNNDYGKLDKFLGSTAFEKDRGSLLIQKMASKYNLEPDEYIEVLDMLDSNGTMTLAEAANSIAMAKNQKYLSHHRYKIFYDEKAQRWRTTVPSPESKGGRKYLKFKTEEELKRAIIQYYKYSELSHQVSYLTVDQAMTNAINHHYKGEFKAPTRERVTCDKKRFFGMIAEKDITRMNSRDWRLYLEDMVDELHPKKKAYKNAKSLLRLTLRYLKNRELIDFGIEDMFEGVEIDPDAFDISYRKDEDEAFTFDEAKILVPYLWEHRTDPECLLLLCMYVTGMRVGEATTLMRNDFRETYVEVLRTAMGSYRNSKGKLVHNAVKPTPKSKAGERTVTYPPGADIVFEYILESNTASEFVFVNKNGEIFSRSAIFHKLQRICHKLGIKERRPHCLRKTYASILSENLFEDAAIIAQMGHADISTTKTHYIKNRNRLDLMRSRLTKVPDLDINFMISNHENDENQPFEDIGQQILDRATNF